MSAPYENNRRGFVSPDPGALRSVIGVLEVDRALAMQTLTAIARADPGSKAGLQAQHTLDVLKAEPMSL